LKYKCWISKYFTVSANNILDLHRKFKTQFMSLVIVGFIAFAFEKEKPWKSRLA
jgi:hypothetical protein